MTRRPRKAFPFSLVLIAALLTGACGGSGPTVLELRYGPAGERGANTAADMKMAPAVDVDYELAPGLARPAGKARAWTASLPGDARERLAALARSLGVEGEVYEQAADQLAVGDPHGATRAGKSSVTMWVGGGPSSWSYYPQSQSSSGSEVTSEPCAPDDPACAAPVDSALRPPVSVPEPKNLPSESEALASARKILAAAGYDMAAIDLEATASSWSTYVSFEERIEGMPTGMFGAVDFGENSTVTSAWGQFARYDGADTYPLVDLDDAVDRLSGTSFGGFATKGGAPFPDIATPDSAVPGSAAPTTTIARTVVVRIDAVELVLQPLYSSQSEVHLVPSYRFSDGDAVIGTVYAVPDKYISVAEPAPIEPAPVDPGTGATTPGSQGSGSSGSSGGDEPDSGAAPPVADDLIPESDARRLVGLTEAEAVKVAESKGWTARVVERDGESFMVTTDWRGDRVNLTVADGTVTAVTVG